MTSAWIGDATTVPTKPGDERAAACAICSDIAAAEAGEDPWAIARLGTGYVRLNPNQYYRGATFFVAARCVSELHHLGRSERDRHLAEMAEVAHAVFVSVAPRKLNYEALGNSVAHLHWWLTPRHDDDPQPQAPIWHDLEFSRPPWSRWHPAPPERDQLRRQLLSALRDRDVSIHQSYA